MVSSLKVQTLTGRTFEVLADTFILCCGGIENARVLLNCSRFFPTGIGNDHGLVGRFFMDHLLSVAGEIIPQDKFFNLGRLLFRGERDLGVPVSLVFKNSAQTIQQQKRSGCSVFLEAEHENSEQISKALSSASSEAVRAFIRDVRAGRVPQNIGERGCAILDDPQSVAAAVYYRMTSPLGNWSALKRILVRLTGEQLPNPSSRIVLTEKVDALGMKKVGLDWRIATDDYDNLYETATTFARGVGATGFGRMRVHSRDELKVETGWHHMGTTRMHDDPRQGVVDRNCRVHGITNFFVAGSSVFPTSSRVNPTLTIVALAIRLADHLKREPRRI
jgi:hypothetical protein